MVHLKFNIEIYRYTQGVGSTIGFLHSLMNDSTDSCQMQIEVFGNFAIAVRPGRIGRDNRIVSVTVPSGYCRRRRGPTLGSCPVLWLLDHARANWVQNNIARQLQQIAVLVDQDCLEAPLEQMTGALMSPVRRLCVYPTELPHSFGEVSIRHLHDQMAVVGHQAVCMTQPVESRHHLRQRTQVHPPVLIVLEDRLAPITTGHHMIQGTGELDSQRSSHASNVPHLGRCYNARTDPESVSLDTHRPPAGSRK